MSIAYYSPFAKLHQPVQYVVAECADLLEVALNCTKRSTFTLVQLAVRVTCCRKESLDLQGFGGEVLCDGAEAFTPAGQIGSGLVLAPNCGVGARLNKQADDSHIVPKRGKDERSGPTLVHNI